jgi:cholesterol transport system auxiliary component
MSRFTPRLRLSRAATLVVMAIGVAGCSGGLHSDAPATQIYVLRASAASPAMATNGAAVARPLDAAGSATAEAPSLQLPRPSADPGLSSELIVLVRSDHRLDYYSGSSWAGTLPDVISTLALDTLRASGQWAAVQESPSPFAADYLLQINIRRFEADYTDGSDAPKVRVVLDCTLARRIGRDLITTFVAEASADAGENRMAAVVAAFEKAANAALAVVAERSALAARTAAVTSAP